MSVCGMTDCILPGKNGDRCVRVHLDDLCTVGLKLHIALPGRTCTRHHRWCVCTMILATHCCVLRCRFHCHAACRRIASESALMTHRWYDEFDPRIPDSLPENERKSRMYNRDAFSRLFGIESRHHFDFIWNELCLGNAWAVFMRRR